jgi:hypothetical protein
MSTGNLPKQVGLMAPFDKLMVSGEFIGRRETFEPLGLSSSKPRSEPDSLRGCQILETKY